MLLILRCWQWAVTIGKGGWERGEEGERKGGEGEGEVGTNSSAGENRYEVYTCVRVFVWMRYYECAAHGCMRRLRLSNCSGFLRVCVWGENEKLRCELVSGRSSQNIKADTDCSVSAIPIVPIITSLISHTGINYLSHERRPEINYSCFMFLMTKFCRVHLSYRAATKRQRLTWRECKLTLNRTVRLSEK